MNATDWIGTTGVSILLIAYFLNLSKKIAGDGIPYITLNLIGAALAWLASALLNYWPFIILEAVWTIASLIILIQKLLKRSS
jgi:hypothetical protein